VSRVGRPSATRTAAGLVAAAALVCSLIMGADAPGQASPNASADPQLAALVGASPAPVPSVGVQPSPLPDPGDTFVALGLEELFDLESVVADGVAAQTVADQTATGQSVADLTGDGLSASTNAKDSDGDGVPDAVEIRLGTNPHKKDSNGNGIPDGQEDPDHDRLTTLFELRKSHTDPGDPDTNNDGIRDGAEDPDGDNLSNAGEQKYHTNPLKRDTNGNGKDDWHEDFDHDGKPNGMEQDNFSLPSNLTPKLSKAAGDIPVSSSHQCHQINGLSKPISCSYAHRSGKLVVLMGDSHAVHWFPAVYAVARQRGWHLLTLTKSACPFVDVPTIRYKVRDVACAEWRIKAAAKLKRLHPALVIDSNLGIYGFVGDGGNPSSAHSEAIWYAGLKRSLKTLHKVADQVILLGDIQDWGGSSLTCLAVHKHDVAACEVRANQKVQVKRDATARKAAAAAHVSFASTRKLSCPYDPCPLVVDRYLVTRDGGHLSATYSAVIWRGILKILPKI